MSYPGEKWNHFFSIRKRKRLPFTQREDDLLCILVEEKVKEGFTISGNLLYEELEANVSGTNVLFSSFLVEMPSHCGPDTSRSCGSEYRLE